MNRALLAVAALSAAACSFAPAYRRPDAGVPEEHRLAKPEETASVADLPWWDVFKDPALQDLIREALEANQDLALAAARVDEARAVLGIAKADFYPQKGTRPAVASASIARRRAGGSSRRAA